MIRDQQLLAAATEIGNGLVRNAVWEGDACAWLTHRTGSGDPAGPTVHMGSAGIGLFLARLAQKTNDGRQEKTAVGALRGALRDTWTTSVQASGVPMKTATDWRFSFYLGVLGVLWAARDVGIRLRNPDLTEEARVHLDRLAATAEAPVEDDLLFGLASAIPVLLDLGRTGWPDAAPLATRLGKRLVRSATRQNGTWSWAPRTSAPKRPPLSGWSHGASGIGWALATLYEATRDPEFRAASLGAFEYERSIFDPSQQNWPDFLQAPDAQGRHPGRMTWCHGAPGIGLARVRSYPILRDERLLTEAAIAAGTTRRRLKGLASVPGAIFPLCCGIAGLAECGWTIEAALDGPHEDHEARTTALAGIRTYGGGSWPTGFPGTADPSLMQGVAGIGHFLLRLVDPHGVPTVLVPPSSVPLPEASGLGSRKARATIT